MVDHDSPLGIGPALDGATLTTRQLATAIAERQLVMVAGSIAAETTATELSQNAELQRRYLGVEPLAERV